MMRPLVALVTLLWSLEALAQTTPRATVEVGHGGPPWGTPAFYVFLILAATVLGGAIFTITRRNMVSAVVGLVGTFIGLAGIYVLLYAHFLAVMQVLVYAGAIMVLFVFVVMVLGRDDPHPWALRSIMTKVAGVFGLGVVGYVVLRLLIVPGLAPKAGAPPPSFGTVSSFGEVLFRKFLFPFEAVSVLLLLAVIGAVVIARGRRGTRSAGPTTGPEPPKEA